MTTGDTQPVERRPQSAATVLGQGFALRHTTRTHLKHLSNALSLLFATVAFMVRCANAATGDPPSSLDPAFSAGLTMLKQATGFIEDARSSTDWKPNLQLL